MPFFKCQFTRKIPYNSCKQLFNTEKIAHFQINAAQKTHGMIVALVAEHLSSVF